MKAKELSNLKKALFILLYDQHDIPDMQLNDSDSDYIDNVIEVLIEKNKKVCPFKRHDCIGRCKVNHIGCAYGLNVDCNRELNDIWRDFIINIK